MAEVSKAVPEGNKVRARKRSTRIDMTPMVDLAFLLLTFFILTTTFNSSRVMDLSMPDRVEDPSAAPLLSASNALSVAIADNNKVYWWIGEEPVATPTSFGASGLRKVLLEHARNDQLFVLIKPHDKARYENVVNVLDEMSIADIHRYALVDFTDEDREVLHRTKAQ